MRQGLGLIPLLPDPVDAAAPQRRCRVGDPPLSAIPQMVVGPTKVRHPHLVRQEVAQYGGVDGEAVRRSPPGGIVPRVAEGGDGPLEVGDDGGAAAQGRAEVGEGGGPRAVQIRGGVVFSEIGQHGVAEEGYAGAG